MAITVKSLAAKMSSPSITPATTSPPPVQTIPGSYGMRILGSLSDRLKYFWFQGPEKFLRKKMEKYKSTVFRTNIPPSAPFLGNVNPEMIAVLDCKSFTNLFDMDLVEKKNILVGDFMPSTKFTGNMRVGVYLDTTEPQHAQVKNFTTDILKRSASVWVSEFLSNIDIMWGKIETKVRVKGSASIIAPLQSALFRFLSISLLGADPANSSNIGDNGYVMLDKWLALQILPTTSIRIFQPLEEIFLHSFAYPFALVSGDYKKLYEFVKKEGNDVVQRGINEYGLTQDEAIHNLLFILGFNAFGGFSVFLPTLIGTLGSDTTGLQAKLREEVKRKGSETLSFNSVKEMELIKSFVYEQLRFKPPVANQFARARKDFVLSSHDSSFQIKKGELLFGYQLLAMRDPKVFDDPETFKPDRFTGEKGKELLNYLFWSNGPQIATPGPANKQCAAKDYVVLTACLFVADAFKRYDSFTGSSRSITAVKKAT